MKQRIAKRLIKKAAEKEPTKIGGEKTSFFSGIWRFMNTNLVAGTLAAYAGHAFTKSYRDDEIKELVKANDSLLDDSVALNKALLTEKSQTTELLSALTKRNHELQSCQSLAFNILHDFNSSYCWPRKDSYKTFLQSSSHSRPEPSLSTADDNLHSNEDDSDKNISVTPSQ